MVHKSMSLPTHNRLKDALLRNAEDDQPIVMNAKDTSFVMNSFIPEETDENVVNLIKSIPCHY